MALFASILAVLSTWAVLATALAGLGFATQRLVAGAPPATADVADAPWLGFASVLLVLTLWHLVAPITGLLTTVVILAGLFATWRERATIHAWWSAQRPSVGVVALVICLAAWLAMRGMGEMTLYDSGMYHIPYVQWVKALPVVPGLGNLHGRLAFNPASLLFDAMLDSGPWTDGSQHIANGFLVAMVVVPAVLRLAAVRPPRPLSARLAFELTMLPAVLVVALRQDVRSLSTDLPVFVIIMIVGRMMFDMLVTPPGPDRRTVLCRITALLGALTVMKLSAAPFAVATGLLALWVERPRPSAIARLLAHPTLSGLAWMVHGAVLSGYPLYPSTLLALPVDWRVSAEQAAAESGWVTMSARNLNTNALVTSREWVGRWVGQVFTRGDLFHHFAAPLVVCMLALAMMMVRSRRESARLPWRRGLILIAPIGVALAVWWLSAPHTRMAQGPMWVLASLCIAVAIGGGVSMSPQQWTVYRIGASALCLVLAARIALGDVLRSAPAERLSTVLNAVLVLRGPTGWMVPTPTPDLLADTSPTGIALAVPRVDNSCWNGPLLCTPHPTTHLLMRRTGDLVAGFRMDGRWAPDWFPNPWIPFLDYWRCVHGTSAMAEVACRQRAQGAPGRAVQ